MHNKEERHSTGRDSRDYLPIGVFILILVAFFVTGYFSLKVLTQDHALTQFTAMPEWIKSAEEYAEELVSRLTKGGELRTSNAPDAREHLRRGHRLYQRKNFLEALQEYNQAVRAEPGNPDAYFWRGRVFVNTGEMEPAADDFKTALKLKPDFSEAYDHLGWLSAKRAEYDQGIYYLSRSIELKPENGWAHCNRGHMLLKKGDLENARKDFERACKLGYQEGCKAYEESRDTTQVKDGE